ncbi:hypothetical protein SK128_023529, partial [Halocaridina rubra]
SSHLMASLQASRILFRSSSDILSLNLSSSTVDFILKQKDSREFLAAIRSLCFSSSVLYFSAS